MNRVLRRALLVFGSLLYYAGLSRILIWRNRRVPKVVLYHACAETESDFIRGLNSNTTPEQFALHLDYLCENYQVIPLEQLETGRFPERAVVITFDDGYRTVYQHAFPQLRVRQLPATIYVVTRTVDNEQLVWVNALTWLLHRHRDVCVPLSYSLLGVPRDLQSPGEILAHVQAHYSDAATKHALQAMFQAAAVDPAELARQAALYISWQEVREMSAAGVQFGSHTAQHPNLSCLADADQRGELDEALHALLAVGGVPSLAYPFGEFNAASRREAIALGHTSLMEVGGVNQPLDLHRVGRVPITARTRAELFAELEIVTPAIAWLKRSLGRS